MNRLSDLALANYYLQNVAKQYGIETIKSNGQLGIYVTDDLESAIDFAQNAQQTLIQNQFASAIGISKGEVLLFNLPNNGKEIAGNPVNVASKFAEDYGEDGFIYIHDTVAEDANIQKLLPKSAEQFTAEISHVELRGWRI